MARPSVLPLPDDQAKRLLAQLGAIDRAHPAGTNRAFLRDFFELVRQITGGVYGAKTYIQLLKQFAAHRGPSATTVNDELQAYKARIFAGGGAAVQSSAESAIRSESRPVTTTNATESSRSAHEAIGRVGELAQLQQVEVDRLRQRAERVERQAELAFRQREEAERAATAAKAELAGVLGSRDQLQATVQQLTAALQLANDRAAAENRENMVRIDRARQEAREEVQALREQLVEARRRVAQLETDKRQTETIVDGLRRLVNELKAAPRHE